MKPSPRSRAWIEIAAPALRRNYRRIAEAVGPDAGVIPMVKADAYGLGAQEVVRALQPEAPWGWGVATVEEAVALREGGLLGRIIVFAPVPSGAWPAAVAYDLGVAVSGEDDLGGLTLEARRQGRPVRVHVEIDTGMGRAGVSTRALATRGPALRAALADPSVAWESVFTHFHSADELGGPGVGEQMAAFRAAVAGLAPGPEVWVHAGNSAGALRLGAAAGGARPGLFLYGGSVGSDLPAPDPVVSVRARIVRIVDAPPGATLGYGVTHRASAAERWATVAIGYGDGLPRALGNCGHALVAGRRVPLVGRISMDMSVANISGLTGVQPGHVATLVGRDGSEEIPLDEVAAQAGTIAYEVLTGLTPRLPRVWTEAE